MQLLGEWHDDQDAISNEMTKCAQVGPTLLLLKIRKNKIEKGPSMHIKTWKPNLSFLLR